MQNIEDWENILKGNSKTLEFTSNEQTKDLVDLTFDKFHVLEKDNDYIYFSSHGLQNCIQNVQSIKLLIILINEGIISDLHIPLEITTKRDNFVNISYKNKEHIYFDPEAITEIILRIDTMEKLVEFRDNFARFRILDWKRFLDKRNKIYIDLDLGHLLKDKKDLLKRLKFDVNSAVLSFGDKKIKMKMGDNQYILCKKIFEVTPKTHVSVDDVLYEIDTEETDDKKVYRAMVNINNRIEKKFNIVAPIKYNNNHYWREETEL